MLQNMFDHKYPISNLHELDLTWCINKITEFEARLDSFETDLHDRLLAETKEYVDEQLVDIYERFTELRNEVTAFELAVSARIDELEGQFDAFTDNVTNMIVLLNNRMDTFEQTVQNEIAGIAATVDAKIAINNEYILDEVGRRFVNIKVINYFTGEVVTVQQMFDYLSELHLENPITYTELAAANITYTAYAALNMTYTELAVKGKSFINP